MIWTIGFLLLFANFYISSQTEKSSLLFGTQPSLTNSLNTKGGDLHIRTGFNF